MRISILLFSLSLTVFGCNTAQRNQQTVKQVPEGLMGSFVDDYGSAYIITNKAWIQGSKIKYHLLRYNKEGNYFIAQNDANNPSDGGLYSRIDIMYFENMEPWHWGYCLTAYKAASIEEAINTAATDRINPRKGCNGYPFSRMKRK